MQIRTFAGTSSLPRILRQTRAGHGIFFDVKPKWWAMPIETIVLHKTRNAGEDGFRAEAFGADKTKKPGYE